MDAPRVNEANKIIRGTPMVYLYPARVNHWLDDSKPTQVGSNNLINQVWNPFADGLPVPGTGEPSVQLKTGNQ